MDQSELHLHRYMGRLAVPPVNILSVLLIPLYVMSRLSLVWD